jgi:hypothetical protein
MNEGPLTPLTPQEASRWVRKTFGFFGHYLEYKEWRYINTWARGVHRQVYLSLYLDSDEDEENDD